VANLGTLSQVKLRDIWRREDDNFTPWLAQNLKELGVVLGMNLALTQSEAPVGDFSVDILARDTGRDRLVIVENQLDDTDHEHLGKLITYAAGLGAAVVIWVCRTFREEHLQALDWLNRIHESQTEFFGVMLELVSVDNSKPAPYFRPVVYPSQWNPIVARAGADRTANALAYARFYESLLNELRTHQGFTAARYNRRHDWWTFPAGVDGYLWGVFFRSSGEVRTNLYIKRDDSRQSTRAFRLLREQSEEIEREFGEPLQWEEADAQGGFRINCTRSGSIDTPQECLDEIQKWCVDRLLRFQKIFGPRIRQVADSTNNG